VLTVPHVPKSFWQGVLLPELVISRQKASLAPQKPKYEQQRLSGHFCLPSSLFTPQGALASQLATQSTLQCTSR
jgi:hypothetical protein